MATKSDFAEKLLRDLRLRKERMAATENSSQVMFGGKNFWLVIMFNLLFLPATSREVRGRRVPFLFGNSNCIACVFVAVTT
ncbi:UNVERIFIED_CONTAM: hypothetical protein Sradi_5143100 [Sesamum radiatum]|uniref:Uncharacterized protein n=1 Tax=Sesamum radiatum TaxID=300843 RepID=A0AAW2M3R9_SESRA